MTPYTAASTRPCDRCTKTAGLIDVSPNGLALYSCVNAHVSFVDLTKLARTA